MLWSWTAAAHRVRQADTNTALLIYGRLAPAWVSLRPWYQHEELKARVNGDATAAPVSRGPLTVTRRLLTRAAPGRWARVAGAAFVGALSICAGWAAWAAPGDGSSASATAWSSTP